MKKTIKAKNSQLARVEGLARKDQFKAPKLPKGITPSVPIFKTKDGKPIKTKKGKRFPTVDGYDNFLSRVGLNNDNALSAGFYTFNLMTKNRVQLEAAYRGSWVVGAIVDSVAEDMTRAGINVTTNESKRDMKDLYSAMSRLQIWQSLRSNTKWGRLYGGSIGVILVKGQKLDTPLDIERVSKGQFQGISVFDRWMLQPSVDEVISEGPQMGLPEYYDIVTSNMSIDPSSSETTIMAPVAVGNLRVHHSRVIRSIGIELPFFQAITEQMWGESVLERLWDRLISFDNATMSAGQLIDRANLRTVGIEGLREIIAAGGKAYQGLQAMFDMMRLAQVNEGLTLLDKNDEFQSTSYSFAGLSDLLLQFGQQLSGACGVPLVRLFGQSPAGLNSTGDADIRMYYDNILAQQEREYRDGMETILRVMWRSVFNEAAPKDLEFEFTPLWQMSAMDKATIGKTNAETIIGAFESNLTDRPTAMKELRETSGDTGLFSNITDEAIKEAEEEEPPMPEGMLPNEGEGGVSAQKSEPSPSSKLDTPKDPVKNIDRRRIGLVGSA